MVGGCAEPGLALALEGCWTTGGLLGPMAGCVGCVWPVSGSTGRLFAGWRLISRQPPNDPPSATVLTVAEPVAVLMVGGYLPVWWVVPWEVAG